MIGIERQEIVELNSLNLIDYLLKTDGANFRKRDNGTIVYKPKDSIVIWDNHSYSFGSVSHAYKDNIGTLRLLYGYTFMEAVDKLRAYQSTLETAIPEYNLFS